MSGIPLDTLLPIRVLLLYGIRLMNNDTLLRARYGVYKVLKFVRPDPCMAWGLTECSKNVYLLMNRSNHRNKLELFK